MWQAHHVRDTLLAAHDGLDVEIVEVKSAADVDLSTPLTQMGSVGIFTQTLERELAANRIDVAVHSLKDVPAKLADGMVMAVYSEREDARDAWFHRDGANVEDAADATTVATGSLRRRSQLLHRWPHFKLQGLRGNLNTRLAKFDEGQFDAMILAAAGVKRLGWQDRVTQWLPIETLLPAVGQGILGLEIREGDAAEKFLSPLNDPAAAQCARAERSLLEGVAGGCVVPLAGYCEAAGGELYLRARLGEPDGSRLLEAETRGTDPEAMGLIVAEQLLAQGGAAIVTRAKESAG
jgi:hydroxymethylbilane synthase